MRHLSLATNIFNSNPRLSGVSRLTLTFTVAPLFHRHFYLSSETVP